MMRGTLLAVAALLIVGSLAGVQNTYRYETGKTYLYNLKSSTDIVVDGTSDAPTNVTQTADVEIAVQSPCEFSLKVKSIKVDGASVPTSFAADVQKNAVRFSFDDGRVGEICPTEDEQTWVLNIKRAMLSTLQNAFEQDGEALETDVSGKCQVTFESRDDNNERHITRSRDMNSCKGHHGLHGAIRASPYDTKSEIQSAPLAERSQECTHQVNADGVLKQANCVESHQFKSFSDRSEGLIKSTTHIQIQFVKKENKVAAASFHAINNRHSLEFDHSEIREQISTEAKKEAHAVIDLLCADPGRVVKSTPTQFTDLVGKLRKMDDATLQTMIKQAESKSKCAQHLRFLMDALPMCGTEACVNVMVDELKSSKKLTAADKHTWFMSMAFVPRVTEKMVERAADLVDSLHGKELLGIGSLVHTFCRNQENCAEIAGVKTLLNKLVAKLGDSCTPTGTGKQAVEKVIITLKAIGNIGSVESLAEDLKKCYEKTENPTEIRIAAIQAMRRVPCSETKKTSLLDLLADRSEEVESRIHAFLSVINCNCRTATQRVNEILEEETVNQVGSFIWSFLREKRQSSNPSDSALKHILRTEPISRRFERDPDQYSRFSQSGSISKNVNSGAHYESGVIYAPGSYLPRSEYFNVTVHLFGHSVNLFEVGARQEGMDHVLDRLMGPEGMLSNPQNYYQFGDKKQKKSNKKLDALDQEFAERDIYKQSKEMSMSFYMKMFGDELAYFGIHDANTMKLIENSYDMKTIGDFLSKERELKMAKNFLFVDTTKTMPTLSGLPLRLTVTGAASMNVVVGGKADLTKVFRQPHSAEIKTTMKPSAAIEITTTLAVQTVAGKVGYVQKARLFTSMAIETEIALEDGKTFKAVTRLPQDRMDIFDIDVQAHRVSGDDLTPVTAVSVEQSEPICSGETLSQLMGIKLCGEMSSAKSDMAMPTKHFGVFIEKTDESLETYEMSVELKTGAITYPKSFVFNTPGSKVDREIRLDVDIDGPTKMVQIRTPIKELKFEGTTDGQNGNLVMTVDGADTYNMEAEFKPEVKGDARLYNVLAKYNKDGESPVTVSAGVSNEMSKRTGSIHAKLEGLSDEPSSFTCSLCSQIATALATNICSKPNIENSTLIAVKIGVPDWSHKKRNFAADYFVKSPEVESTAALEIKMTEKESKALLSCRHEIKQGGYEPYDFRFEMNSDSSKTADDKTKTSHKLELTKSFHPQSNFEVTIGQEFGRSSYEKLSSVRYGADLAREGKMKLKWERDQNNKWMIKAHAHLNEFGIDHKANINMLNKMPEKFELKGEINRPGAVGDVILDLNYKQGTGPKYEMEAEAKLSGVTEMRLFKKINQVNDHEYKSETIVQWAEDKQAEIKSDVTIKSNSYSDYEYKMDSNIKVSGVAEPMQFTKHVKQHNSQMKYIAKLTSGARSLYELDMDVDQKDTTKAKFNMMVKSHYVTGFDMSVGGDLAREGNTNKLTALAKKESKDFARVEIFVPIKMQGPENHFRTQVQWALDTNAPKELTGEYKLMKQPNGNRDHEIMAKSQLNGNNYKWQAHVTHDDYYKMNNTFTMNNKQVMEMSWGMLLAGPSTNQAIDFQLKTLKPMTKRHLTGNMIVNAVDPAHLLLNGEVKCHLSQKRAGYDFEFKIKNNKIIGKTLVNIGDYEFNGNYETLNTKDMVESKNDYLVKWGSGKVYKQVQNMKLVRNKQMTDINYDLLIETPWDSMKTFETNSKLKCNMAMFTPCNGGWTQKWNDREWSMNGETKDGGVSLTMSPSEGAPMTVAWTSSQSGSDKVQRGFSIRMGDDNVMKADFTRVVSGDPNYVMIWEAKKGDSFDLKSRVEYKIEGHKMITNMEFKNNDDLYKMSSDIDTKKDTGVIKIQTPLSELKSAKLEVAKAGNKYTIKSERNGEEGAIIEGEMSGPDDSERTMKVSFKGIDNPIDIDAAYSAERPYKIRLVVTKEGDQSYGFDISDVNEETASKKVEGIQMTLVHPTREPQLKFVVISEQPSDYRMEMHISPDTKTSKVPTIFGNGMSVLATGTEYITYISDPRLTNKIQWTGRMLKSGDVELRFTYSDLESKAFVIKGKSENKRLELTFVHEESKLDNKFWYEAQSGADFSVGMEYKVKESVKQVALTVKMRSNNYAVEVSYPGSQGTLKYESKKVKGGDREHRIMWFADGQVKPSWVLAGIFVPEKMTYVIEMRKAAAGQVLLHMSDQLVSDDLHESRVWHLNNKKRVDDVYGKLWLAKPDLLKYRLHMRPESWTDVMAVVKDFGSSSAGKTANPQNSMVIRDMITGWSTTYKTINRDLINAAKEMDVYWRAEQKLALWKMANDLGMPEAAEWLEDYSELMTEMYNANLDIMEMSAKEWTESMGEGLGDLSVVMTEMMEQMMTPMGDMFSTLSNLMSDVGYTLREWNRAISEFMQSNQFFKQLADFLEKLMEQIRGVMRNADIDQYKRSFNDYLNTAENNYGEYVQYGRDYLDWLMEYSTIRGAYSGLQPIIDEIATVDLRDMIDRVFEYLRSISKGQMLTKYMPKVTQYKPEEGKFEIEMPLPMKVSSLRDLAEAYEPKQFTNELQKIASSMEKLFNTNAKVSEDIWIRRGINGLKGSDEVYGNHASSALIINDGKHANILTFDGHSYQVSRSCEMLLAKDFINNKFSVSGTFAKKGGALSLTEVTVTYADDSEIIAKLTDDGKVLINGVAQELPWQQMDQFNGVPVMTIKRTDHGVELSTFDGVVIKRDWFYSTMSVTLPGYYHGHSAGLLGSNDNEYSNDLHLVNGDMNEDVDTFVQSYTVGGKCAPHTIETQTLESEECATKFSKRNSPFRTCFRRVPPSAFHGMCTPTNVCNVTAAYIATCGDAGIELYMPQECLKCTEPKDRRFRRTTHHKRAVEFTGGQTFRYGKSAVKDADVVFVVSEQPCMEFAKDKIVEVAQSIKQKLSAFKSVNFGMIGYNGVGVHSEPHMHTGDYQVNFALDGLRKAVAELDMEDDLNVATEQDPLSAVQFAATQFPFRAAAQKTIVLWTCGQCGAEANYYDVQSELLQRGIQLHVLTTERVEIEEESESDLLGFDAGQMFTTNGVQADLRASLSSPHDSCTVLAQETNGTVWSVADQASSVFTMPSEQISAKITQKYESVDCVECECDSNMFAPRTVCYPCEVPTPVSLTGSSFFNVPYVQLRNTYRSAKKTIGATDMWIM